MNCASNPPGEIVPAGQESSPLGESIIVVILELPEWGREYGLPSLMHISGLVAAGMVPMLADAIVHGEAELPAGPSPDRMSDKAAQVCLNYLLDQMSQGGRDPTEVMGVVVLAARLWGKAHGVTSWWNDKGGLITEVEIRDY